MPQTCNCVFTFEWGDCEYTYEWCGFYSVIKHYIRDWNGIAPPFEEGVETNVVCPDNNIISLIEFINNKKNDWDPIDFTAFNHYIYSNIADDWIAWKVLNRFLYNVNIDSSKKSHSPINSRILTFLFGNDITKIYDSETEFQSLSSSDFLIYDLLTNFYNSQPNIQIECFIEFT